MQYNYRLRIVIQFFTNFEGNLKISRLTMKERNIIKIFESILFINMVLLNFIALHPAKLPCLYTMSDFFFLRPSKN